jgi:hypothetical protein
MNMLTTSYIVEISSLGEIKVDGNVMVLIIT